jgi:hypothetical protein
MPDIEELQGGGEGGRGTRLSDGNQLALYERQVQVALRWGQRAALRVAPQPDSGVEDGGSPVGVDH